MRPLLFFMFAMLSTKSSAQELFVFSEIPLLAAGSAGRMGCDAVDGWQDAAPISPAVEQGGNLTFVVAVGADTGKPFLLDVGQNPANSFAVRLHRLFPGSDLVDAPVAVPIRFSGRVLEGHRCALFLLEVGVPATVPVGRVKLEPAVWVPNPKGENFWIRYPMEVRVLAAPKAGDAVLPVCPATGTSFQAIILRAIPRLLGSCLMEADLAGLAAKVREKRRIQGKNQ